MILKNIGLFTVLLPKVAASTRMFYLTKQPVSSLYLHVKAILLYLDFEQAKEIWSVSFLPVRWVSVTADAFFVW